MFHDLHSSQNLTRVIESRRMRWRGGNVTRMRDRRVAYRIYGAGGGAGGGPEVNSPLGSTT
jgi:hypothetical protein